MRCPHCSEELEETKMHRCEAKARHLKIYRETALLLRQRELSLGEVVDLATDEALSLDANKSSLTNGKTPHRGSELG